MHGVALKTVDTLLKTKFNSSYILLRLIYSAATNTS